MAANALTVLVLTSEGCRFGLVVERVLNAEEIVVKPLSRQLQQIGAYLGATILGDGRIALILDVRSLARRARVVRERDLVAADQHDGPAADHDVAEPLLIVDVAGRRVGVPLSSVTRLEEVAVTDVEHAGEHDVVQYRGQLVRLGRLSTLLGCTAALDRHVDVLDVIVYTHGDHSVGFIVDAVLDIASEGARFASRFQRPGRLRGRCRAGSCHRDSRCGSRGPLGRSGFLRGAGCCAGEFRNRGIAMSPKLMATFTVGELLLGVDIDVVQEVIGQQDITDVPLAAHAATGLINLRGEVVTAIDMRGRFELASRLAEDAPMNVVVRVAGELVSLLVDAIGDVVEVLDSQFEELPETVSGMGRELIRGAYKRADGLLLALDVARAVGHDQPHPQPI